MVPLTDNDTINTVSQSHYDSLTPAQALIEILKQHQDFIHDIRKDQIDVNEFNDDSSSGTTSIGNPLRVPMLITDIIATWVVQNQAITYPPTVINPVAVGASTVATINNNPYTVAVTVSGGVLTGNTLVNGNNTGLTTGTFYIPPAGTITTTYTTAPAYATAALPQPVQANVPANGTATLTFGGRTYELNYASGSFQALGMSHGLRLDNTANANKVTLQVTPASAVHLEIAGTADYRKIERL